MEIESDECGCTGDTQRAGVDPAYRRALWWVVGLNIGFGLCEIVGGFLANSQALKADALDFLGDGSITFVGLLALGWRRVCSSARWVSGCSAWRFGARLPRPRQRLN
jgi:Co/Zn/Cd efflux system component